MHGALLAAAIANRGQMPAPMLIDRAVDRDGRPIAPAVANPRHVVDAAAAREVGRMMELTTRIGTAKGTFRDKRGRRLLPFEVAGKTGTLSAETDHGYVGYSWFVGYAPAERPTIAFAVVLGNNPNWRIKATYVGRHIVTEYLGRRSPRRLACWRQSSPRPGVPGAPKPPTFRLSTVDGLVAAGHRRIDCPAPRKVEKPAACSFTNGSQASRMIAAAPRRSFTATRTCRGAACSTASTGARRSCTRWASGRAPGSG